MALILAHLLMKPIALSPVTLLARGLHGPLKRGGEGEAASERSGCDATASLASQGGQGRGGERSEEGKRADERAKEKRARAHVPKFLA